MRRIASQAEMLLLIANFISRRGIIPDPKPDWMLHHPDGRLTNLQQQHCQEDCFRKVISDPGMMHRCANRAGPSTNLATCCRLWGKTSVAEMLYGQALADLEKCPAEQHDLSLAWHAGQPAARLGRLSRVLGTAR